MLLSVLSGLLIAFGPLVAFFYVVLSRRSTLVILTIGSGFPGCLRNCVALLFLLSSWWGWFVFSLSLCVCALAWLVWPLVYAQTS